MFIKEFTGHLVMNVKILINMLSLVNTQVQSGITWLSIVRLLYIYYTNMLSNVISTMQLLTTMVHEI